MRFGALLIQFGVYLMMASIKLMKTDKTNNPLIKTKESYDKNVWYVTLWERYNFLWLWSIFLIFELYRITFSFTNAFGDDVWVYIGVYKVAGIISELIIIYYLKDDLQLLIISTELGLMENLTTAGADNLIEFLQGYIIGIAMIMVE